MRRRRHPTGCRHPHPFHLHPSPGSRCRRRRHHPVVAAKDQRSLNSLKVLWNSTEAEEGLWTAEDHSQTDSRESQSSLDSKFELHLPVLNPCQCI